LGGGRETDLFIGRRRKTDSMLLPNAIERVATCAALVTNYLNLLEAY
jgi:hypothetical protein